MGTFAEPERVGVAKKSGTTPRAKLVDPGEDLAPPQGRSYFADSSQRPYEFIHSGSTLLDCVIGGGWPLGRIGNIVGDKSTGKTLIAMEAIANFFLTYPQGRTAYLEAEAAFDEEYADRLGIPVSQIEFEYELDTVEQFFKKLESLCKELEPTKKPALVVLDSLDALSDAAELERGIDDGSYGAGKAKKMSELFRRLVRQIKRTRICLLIISQVRDNIGVTFGKKYSRSGGRALDFYASQVIYLAHLKQLSMTRRGVKRAYGICIKAKCDKNKIGLPFRECEFEIHFGYGIQDLKSCEEFLSTIKYKGNVAKLTDEQLRETVREEWSALEQEFLPTETKYPRLEN